MKKIFTFLFVLSALALPLRAQDIDETFVFLDEEYEIIENGATIVRNVVDYMLNGTEVIYSGISVLDNGAETNDCLKVHYTISRLDNGVYQICFPTTCNSETAVGVYETPVGALLDGIQDLNSEWLPVADGVCIVDLSIEVMTQTSKFPPVYAHKADGPTLKLMFVKGDMPDPKPLNGDVNDDGEVNINDVNIVIDVLLSGDSAGTKTDVDGDGEVTISDVNWIIDYILNKEV